MCRNLFGRLGLADRIDSHTKEVKDFVRPELATEIRITLLLCGGGLTADSPLLRQRGARRMLGWTRVPDPMMFGCRLRRTRGQTVPLPDRLLWTMVRRRRALRGGVPARLTLPVDSTVVGRAGREQVGTGDSSRIHG